MRDAAAHEEILTGALTRLIKDNIDCEIARLRTFDVCWLVDLSTGLCQSWPLEKFIPPPKSSVAGGSSLSRSSSVVSSSAASAVSGMTGVTGSSGGSSASSYLTPEKLAWAGFYYAPTAAKDDKCVCFICGASRYDWFSTDDPILFHLPTCVFKQQAYSDPEILQERIMPIPPPPPPSSRKGASRRSRGTVASSTVTWRTRAPAELEARLSFMAITAQAKGVEEWVKEEAMQKTKLKSAACALDELQARAREAGEAAFTVVGHEAEDVASNGVLAFLSAFDEQGLHSRHTGVGEIEGELVDALMHASAAPPQQLRDRIDAVSQEVVDQV